MNRLNRAFWRMTLKSEAEVRNIAADGHGLQKLCARMALLALDAAETAKDFPGQKREKNGQFGEGKKPGTSSYSAGVHKSEAEIRNYLSGSPTINQREMNKHIEGTGEYRKYLHNRLGKGLPPQGYFDSKDQKAVENEVIEKLKCGKYELAESRGGTYRAVVYLDSIRGTTYNQNNEQIKTGRVKVAVSEKNGIHIFPDKEGE